MESPDTLADLLVLLRAHNVTHFEQADVVIDFGSHAAHAPTVQATPAPAKKISDVASLNLPAFGK